ncbi:MAG TPA: SRPBCC family protein [Thermoanaerobaculia bacterium]|nr:SRPBCC family protein [Thermoanaerobaculia bacterium]
MSRKFEVQGVELQVPVERAFSYIADPARLPSWTSAFATVEGERACLRTPAGEVEIGLAVESSADRGTIDWHMSFPDGSVAVAYSRVVALSPGSSAYSFVLTAPPVPLEQLEGALDAQSRTLAAELLRLKGLLEGHEQR